MQQTNKYVGILSLLAKAQETLDQSVSYGNHDNGDGAAQLNGDSYKNAANANLASESVMNFFASAKPATKDIPSFNWAAPAKPVHVDQIEMHQRKVTKCERNSPQLSNGKNVNIPHPSATFKRIASPHEVDASNCVYNASSTMTDANGSEHSKSRQKSEPEMFQNNDRGVYDATKPKLMLPTMFSSMKMSTDKTGISMTPPLTNQHVSSHVNPSGKSTKESLSPKQIGKPEPLTHKQLLQAMSYLIKTDNAFVKKLHEAYLLSLNEMLSL